MRRLLVLFVLAPLAACQTVCPAGARLRGSAPPGGTSQWCERTDPILSSSVPAPGRDYEAVLGLTRPTARGRSLEGPAIEWHWNFRVASFGHFAISADNRSVPHGVFTFWRYDGQRQAQIRYHMGEPVGCAGVWDEQGRLHTGIVEQERFRETGCELELDERATRIAADNGFFEPPTERPLAALAVGTMLTSGDVPISTAQAPAVGVGSNIRVDLTRPLRWVGVGLTTQVWSGDNGRLAVGAAPLVTWSRPTPVPRVSIIASAEAGIRLYSARDRMDSYIAVEPDRVATVYGAVTAGLAVQLSKYARLRARGVIAQDLERQVEDTNLYCSDRCFDGDTTWHAGGLVAGALLGIEIHVY